MKNKFIATLMILVLSACNLPKIEPIKPPAPIDQMVRMEMEICDKSESDLPLGDIEGQEPIVVKDTIETKDISYVDCDGNKSNGGRGPVRNLDQIINIGAPSELSDKVNFIQVDNLRTCSTQRIDSIADKLLETQVIPNGDNEPTTIPGPILSAVGQSGVAKIFVSDIKMKLSALCLNVLDKKNVLKIQYFGKCLKYKENKDDTRGDAFNCLEAEQIGKKQVLVIVEVERPEVQGTHEKSMCYK